jgi:hypothetical protein
VLVAFNKDRIADVAIARRGEEREVAAALKRVLADRQCARDERLRLVRHEIAVHRLIRPNDDAGVLRLGQERELPGAPKDGFVMISALAVELPEVVLKEPSGGHRRELVVSGLGPREALGIMFGEGEVGLL